MLTLGKVWIIIVLSVGFVYADSVRATVDTIEVAKGNPVTLRIKAIGDNVVFPTIQKVANAPVVGISNSSSTNLSIINGSMINEQSVTQRIQFVPEENMTIPSYTVSIDGIEYKTDSIDIKVVKQSASNPRNNEVFFLKMTASKTKLMVGESLVLIVYFSLKNGVQLSQDVQYNPPSLTEFIVTNTNEKNTYTKEAYQVQEIRYILTAQKEGNFTITPAQVKIGLPDRSRRDIFGLSYATKWLQAMSNELKIEVVPSSKESDLIGDFTIDTTVDKEKVKPNKPVNLTVKIEGKGNLAGFEFPAYDIDGVTVYTDEAKIQTKIVDDEIYNVYTKSFAFISDRDFVIPEKSFSMLTLKDKTLKTLDIPAYSIEIEGDNSVVASTEIKTPAVETNLVPKHPKEEPKLKKEELIPIVWWRLALAFILGALTLYAVQAIFKGKKNKEKHYKESDALKILYAHISEDKETEEMVRKLYARKNGDKSVKIDKKELREMLERFR